VEYEASFIESVERNYNTKSFRFTRAQGFEYSAGQFFYLTLDKNKVKHFSFSESPTQKGFIEFTTRLTGSEYKNAVNRLKPGDTVRIGGPNGEYTYKEEYEKIAFLSGGIGITAIRSICKYLGAKKPGTNVVFLYQNEQEKDILFKEDFEELAKRNRNMRIIDILKDPPDNWSGLTGEIDKTIVAQNIPDYAERMFYVSGPPSMVLSLIKVLIELGVDKKRIKMENFVGY
jgi:glycine betaine catabolism B